MSDIVESNCGVECACAHIGICVHLCMNISMYLYIGKCFKQYINYTERSSEFKNQIRFSRIICHANF